MSDVKDIHTLLQLQAIVTQSTKNMQTMQEQLHEYIEQSEQQANHFIDQFSAQLPQKIIKPLNECIHEAKYELKNAAQEAEKELQQKLQALQEGFKKTHLYKSFCIQIAAFTILALSCYIFIWLQKQQLEELISTQQEQIQLLNQHAKNIHLKECPIQGKNYPCVKIYHDQPTFKHSNGHIYALIKP